MPAKKRFASSKRVAKLRDKVLSLSHSGDLEGARSALEEVLSLRDTGLISEENMTEFNCRVLESEIDIAAIETKPIHSLANERRH